MPDTRLNVNGIEIIDSLKPGERQTAKTLHAHLEPICRAKSANATCGYTYARGPEDVISAIVSIRDNVLRTGQFPILHIEAHGCPEGIELASGDGLTWEQLRPYLSALNCATKVSLVVMMAACKGACLDSLFLLGERAPMLAMLAPLRDIDDGPLERAMIAFYTGAFIKGDGTRAWWGMNGMVDPDRLMFDVRHAETRFEQRLQQFVRAGGALDASMFDALRRRYFFLDIIDDPEHARRFRLTFESFTERNASS